MANDIGQMLVDFSEQAKALQDLIVGVQGIGVAEIIGTLLIALALIRANRAANPSSGVTIGQIISPLIIGGMLIAWHSTTKMVSESLALSCGALGYKVGNASPYSQSVIDAVLILISVFGSMAVLRGLLKWKDAGEGKHSSGGDPVWAGLWHIIGGGIAMNMSDFLKMLGF